MPDLSELLDWLDKRAQPNSGIRYEVASFDLETGRAHQSRVELHAEDADFIVKHFHGRGAADLAAVLRTRPAASTMEGWRLVPEEYTYEMNVAFCKAAFLNTESMDAVAFGAAYDAMLAAAPIPPDVMK